MKTLCITSTILLAALGPVAAQDAAIDVQTLQQITLFRGEMNGTELHNKINQLLEQAKLQVDRLDQQLARTGDYAGENFAGVTSAQQGLAAAAAANTMPKTAVELGEMRDKITGEEVFTDKVPGVFKPIGETFTDKDGKTKNRDKARYKPEAKQLANVKEFYRIRDTAILKQQELEGARLQAHLDLLETPDGVAGQRLTALIGSYDADLIAVRQDIANASSDLQAQERTMALQSTVEAKASIEESAAGRLSSRPTAAQVTEAVKGMPNGGKMDAYNKDSRLPFKPKAGEDTTPPDIDP